VIAERLSISQRLPVLPDLEQCQKRPLEGTYPGLVPVALLRAAGLGDPQRPFLKTLPAGLHRLNPADQSHTAMHGRLIHRIKLLAVEHLCGIPPFHTDPVEGVPQRLLFDDAADKIELPVQKPFRLANKPGLDFCRSGDNPDHVIA
jgi:hypothetical protein